jgi:hypothetical protein
MRDEAAENGGLKLGLGGFVDGHECSSFSGGGPHPARGPFILCIST